MFPFSAPVINRYLHDLGKKLFGDDVSRAREVFSNLSMYDFRHSSACFWVRRYKSESALKYRMGWKKSDMIHYYTEFLGMKDTIKDEDMYVDITKTQLEQELQELKSSIDLKVKKAVDEYIGKFQDKIHSYTGKMNNKIKEKIR